MQIAPHSREPGRRAQRWLFGAGALLIVGLIVGGLVRGSETVADAAVVPATDAEVVERLPAGAAGREGASLRQARLR